MLFSTDKNGCFLHRLWDLQGCSLLMGRWLLTDTLLRLWIKDLLHQFGEGLSQGLARKMWCLWYEGMRFDTTAGPTLPLNSACVGQKKDFFFLAKISALNLVKRVKSTCGCFTWWQVPVILVTSPAQRGKYALCSTFCLDRPFAVICQLFLSSLLELRFGGQASVLHQHAQHRF